MTENQKIVKKVFADNGIDLIDEDLEKIGTAIADSIRELAEKIERDEPYATTTIHHYRYVASSIDSIIDKE